MSNVIELVDLLKEKGLHIATAESCTGGLIASEIVSVAGSSSVFDQGFVTYANEAKVKYLHVNQKTIDKYGVVSEQVAYEMAIGALKESNADVALATTGIAGPGGGTFVTPVGMVCFGLAIKDKIYTCTKQFGDIGRNNVRELAKEYVIKSAISFIEKL